MNHDLVFVDLAILVNWLPHPLFPSMDSYRLAYSYSVDSELTIPPVATRPANPSATTTLQVAGGPARPDKALAGLFETE